MPVQAILGGGYHNGAGEACEAPQMFHGLGEVGTCIYLCAILEVDSQESVLQLSTVIACAKGPLLCLHVELRFSISSCTRLWGS